MIDSVTNTGPSPTHDFASLSKKAVLTQAEKKQNMTSVEKAEARKEKEKIERSHAIQVDILPLNESFAKKISEAIDESFYGRPLAKDPALVVKKESSDVAKQYEASAKIAQEETHEVDLTD